MLSCFFLPDFSHFFANILVNFGYQKADVVRLSNFGQNLEKKFPKIDQNRTNEQLQLFNRQNKPKLLPKNG